MAVCHFSFVSKADQLVLESRKLFRSALSHSFNISIFFLYTTGLSLQHLYPAGPLYVITKSILPFLTRQAKPFLFPCIGGCSFSHKRNEKLLEGMVKIMAIN
jgi:hypothetical protein